MDSSIFIFFYWLAFAGVVSFLGKDREIGGGKAFVLSVLLSPLIGLIITLASPSADPRATSISPESSRLFAEGEKKIRDKDYEGAIHTFERLLDIQPFAPITNYYLAILYSARGIKDKAFTHLTLAVEQGFKDFATIHSSPNLDFLRSQPEFGEYARNGYKFPPMKSTSDDVITKLEKLGVVAHIRVRA